MNTTPKASRPLVALCTRGELAAEILGGVIGLSHNPALVIAADLYSYAGRLADPAATPPITAIAGKQPLYLEAKAQHALKRATLRQAVAEGREFIANAVDTLKVPLGRRWNSRWEAAGFSGGSISIVRLEPVPVLMALAAYYQTHAAHENAAEGLTAAKADELKSAIVAAQGAADGAKAAEKAAKQLRDAALKQLRERVSSLRTELSTLLEPDDSRWYQFGFRRPVDGSTPDLIEELRLLPGGAGRVTAEWLAAPLAANYRVSWKLAASTDEPTEVGLFTDPQAIISGLPSGQTVLVIVTARNGAGESAPVDATIVVP